MSVFVICNGENKILNLEGVKMFGKKVKIAAMFTEEVDALEVLFAAEEQCGLKDHVVRKINSVFAAELEGVA